MASIQLRYHLGDVIVMDLTLCFHKMSCAINVGGTEARLDGGGTALDIAGSFLKQILALLWFLFILFCLLFSEFCPFVPYEWLHLFEIPFFTCLSIHSCYYFLLRSFPPTPLPFLWLILQGSTFLMEISLTHHHPCYLIS